MRRDVTFESILPRVEDEVLVTLERPGTPLGELAKHFPDPRDLFICAPTPVDARALARLYYGDEDGFVEPDRIREVRTRMREERWREARAVFQGRRSAARREQIIEAESTAWAMLGVDFHMSRVRSLWDRWDMLNSSVVEALKRVEAGERPFDTALRDMSRELREVEGELERLMPKLALTERAQHVWTGRARSREELVDSISRKLRTVVGGEQAKNVFELIEGGFEAANGGGEEG